MRADDVEGLLERDGGDADEERLAQVVRLLDAGGARRERGRIDLARQREPGRAERLAREQQRAQDIEAAEALAEWAVLGVEQDALGEQQAISCVQPQLPFVTPEGPPLAARAAAGGEHVDGDGGRAGSEPDVDA